MRYGPAFVVRAAATGAAVTFALAGCMGGARGTEGAPRAAVSKAAPADGSRGAPGGGSPVAAGAAAPKPAQGAGAPAAAPGKVSRYPGWPTTDWSAFPTLARDDRTAPRPPTRPAVTGPIAGDPEKGKRLVGDRSRGGGCVTCHILPGQPLPGNVGPNLSNYAELGRPDEFIFTYVYDARTYNPATVMPPWGTNGVFTADEIKDIVAYLKTLKGPVIIPAGAEDPNSRPIPKDTRDNLDPTVNPAVFVLDDAAELFETKGPKGIACAACHPDPERSLRGAATRYPRWDTGAGKVLGVEEFLVRHAKTTTGHDWPMQSHENLAMSIFVRYQSNGLPVNVDTTSPGAREAYERGKALVARKIGQLNFACLDCHDKAANRWVRGQYLTGQRGQVPHFPTWRTSQGLIWDIRKRFQWCNVAIRANNLPPDAPEYGDLELYLTSLSNGLPINVPGIRH